MTETKSATTTSVADKLRAAFPAEHIGKLPRVTCKACSNAPRGNCDEHSKSRCPDCGNWITERHIHLDYVGHADVTSRLLEADPSWNWEPAASDEHGLPVFDTDAKDSPVGLWIKLTVGGVTRLGYGSCPSNQNDAVKVLIGDALRNAAMRFGVALDLWAKGDRADPAAENATASGGQAQRRRPPQQEESRPAEHSTDIDDGDWGDWHQAIDGITCQEDADRLDADLREVFKERKLGPTKAKNIRAAIKAKAQLVSDAQAGAPELDQLAQRFGGEATAVTDAAALRKVHQEAMKAGKLQTVITLESGYQGTLLSYITSRKAELEMAAKADDGQAAGQ